MKTKTLVFLLLIVFLFFFSKQASALTLVGKKPVEADIKANRIDQIESRKLDGKAKILAKYLARYNSPLEYHAQDFIDASDAFNLDWRLLPAIAGVESTFGKHIPGGYNAWGWGVYGTQAIYFQSWRDAIFTIGQGLRENYLNKGLNDPYAINRIYAASTTWGSKVSFFMEDMNRFANEFEAENLQTASVGQSPRIAAISGQLALR